MIGSKWRTLALCLFSLISLSLMMPATKAVAADTIWIEGEAPASVAPDSIKPSIENVGRPQYLSGGNWLKINMEAGDVAKQMPTDGIMLTYNFSAPKDGRYDLWDRLGFERVRSPFDWRVDSGAWTTVKADADSVDVEELQTWNPIGWVPLGTQQIASGPHTLQIRLTKYKDEKGNDAHILYASDALCLTTTPFHPDGPHKPGERSEADKTAASQVFAVTAPTGAAQTATSLKGTWQIAADDEMVVDDRLGPIKAAPNADDLSWHAISVPGDRNSAFPEMTYVHRYWLRTESMSRPHSQGGHCICTFLPKA